MTSFEERGIADFKILRQRIDEAKPRHIRMAFAFQYLMGSRVSEVCGKYAINGNDLTKLEWNDNPIAVFKIQTAKRKGRPRHLAIPLEESYEPWTSDLVEYFEKRKSRKKVFNFTPRTLQNHGSRIFRELQYPIESYKIANVRIPEHLKQITTHGLRHLRATELMLHYGFDQVDLTIFMGWTFRAAFGVTVGTSIDRYVFMQYSRYLPKLLKPNPFVT